MGKKPKEDTVTSSRLPSLFFVPLSFEHERNWQSQGFQCIAGIDEVGRGPLAGPVVAAAVVLNPQNIPQGLNDSKALTAAKRESVFECILATAHVGIASIPAPVIDRINIRQASLLAMRHALLALDVEPDLALVDGRDRPDVPCRAEALIKGDAQIASIAAASIVAKVVRDRAMKKIARFFPHYHFDLNAGYGVKAHMQALADFGPTPCHRLSFSPLSQYSFKF